MTSDEESVIENSYRNYRFGARMLEVIILILDKMSISHHRIHTYLMQRGLARGEPAKRRQRKWVRYERDHSMSAGHIDWHESAVNGKKLCAIIDDSSRKILAAGEFDSVTTANTITVLDAMVREYENICPLRELIMDHGSEFGAHRRDENGEWDSEFKRHLEELSIRPILARVKHPQTNGKIEKWFDNYRRFRSDFTSLEDYINWYNNRPHGSLDFNTLETPSMAFWRRLPKEAIFNIGVRIFGW